MTVAELYKEAIKPLRPDERLHMAKLILDDLSLDVPQGRPSNVRDFAQLEQMLLDSVGLGPLIEADSDFWAQREQRVVEKSGAVC